MYLPGSLQNASHHVCLESNLPQQKPFHLYCYCKIRQIIKYLPCQEPGDRGYHAQSQACLCRVWQSLPHDQQKATDNTHIHLPTLLDDSESTLALLHSS